MEYCNQCGAAVTRHQENLFVCGNGHETWINAVPGVMVYVIKDGRVLFGERTIEPNKGGLDAPGGFLGLGETAEQATVRELREEAGITVPAADLNYLGTYVSDYAGRQILSIVFVAAYDGPEATMGDDMGGQPVWRALNDLPTADELSFDWQVQAQADLVRLGIV